MLSKVVAFTDGGSRGNPGPGAIAVLLFGPDGEEELLAHAERIGATTNNRAEYRALIKALELAATLTSGEVACFCDSQVVASQASGKYAVKEPQLRELHAQLKQREKAFAKVTYTHVPRENPRIQRADHMLNAALDAAGG